MMSITLAPLVIVYSRLALNNPMARRGVLPDGEKVIVVDADEVDSEKARRYSDLMMSVLRLDSCKNLVSEWVSQSIVSIEALLTQLDPSLQDWPYVYMCRHHMGSQLHVIGVGSNRQRQERAGRLALALAALLQDARVSSNLGMMSHPRRELHEEYELATGAPLMQIQHCAVTSSAEGFRPTQRGAPERNARAESWTPASQSWIWWFDDYLVACCENMSSNIFFRSQEPFHGVDRRGKLQKKWQRPTLAAH